MATLARRLVSKKKKRFQEDGYDLDLTYITKNIVAMGWPSENFESMFRNPMSDIKRLLESRHSGKYKIWNLCAEREYDISNFHNRVERILLYDHMAPPFKLIGEFCTNADQWLKEDPGNIAVVHCKAGKGRTGVMICCYLVYSGQQPDADSSLAFYGKQRTKNGQGVTIPSQRRYVKYFCDSNQKFNGQIPFENQILSARSVVISNCPKEYTEVKLVITGMDKSTLYESQDSPVSEKDQVHIKIADGVTLQGDFKVDFFKGENSVFHFWFNTGFVDNNLLSLSRTEIDGSHKEKHIKKFGAGFKIDVHFTLVQADTKNSVTTSTSQTRVEEIDKEKEKEKDEKQREKEEKEEEGELQQSELPPPPDKEAKSKPKPKSSGENGSTPKHSKKKVDNRSQSLGGGKSSSSRKLDVSQMSKKTAKSSDGGAVGIAGIEDDKKKKEVSRASSSDRLQKGKTPPTISASSPQIDIRSKSSKGSAIASQIDESS